MPVVNTINHRGEHDVLSTAEEDHESVVELTRDLVAIPSRGGVDSYEPVLDRLSSWLRQRNLSATVLKDNSGSLVGLTCEVTGSRSGPRWVLDAPLDTAPFGDENAWTHPPTSAVVDDGWLYGAAAPTPSPAPRSSATSPPAWPPSPISYAASWCCCSMWAENGGFGGATRYFEGPDAPNDVAGVMIGYPGMDKLVIGGRGVYRAKLHVHGVASHSGGSKTTPSAIEKAAHLIRVLSNAEIPDSATPGFPLPGKLTVTAIQGGQGYSVTPDLCTLNVDIRTTPAFDDTAATSLLEQLVAHVDDDGWPGTRPTLIQVDTRWPAYALSEDARLRSALLGAAKMVDVAVEAKIAGPSNIGNYLAGLGIPATAGFGVTYTGLHASDERIRIDTIPTVQAIYHSAALDLLDAD